MVIVENGSDEASTAALRVRFPSSPFVRLDENVGYARAANRGAPEQTGEHVLLRQQRRLRAPSAPLVTPLTVGRPSPPPWEQDADYGPHAKIIRESDTDAKGFCIATSISRLRALEFALKGT